MSKSVDSGAGHKRNKRIKFISLILFTLIIVVAVVLIVYFVDKEDKKPSTVYGIGETMPCRGVDVTVLDVDFRQSLDGVSAGENKVLAVLYVRVDGKTYRKDLKVDGAEPQDREWSTQTRVVNAGGNTLETDFAPAGEKVQDQYCLLVYEVNEQGVHYLKYKDNKDRVALGQAWRTEE